MTTLREIYLLNGYTSEDTCISTGMGDTLPSNANVYVTPAVTALSGASDYYFTYFVQPPTSGSTTGSAYTMYLEGAPSGAIANPYAIYVASGKSYFEGGIQIPSGAVPGYMLTSDASGNASWSSTITTGFGDGSASAPSIYFTSDTGLNTGFYRVGEDNIGITTGGTKRIDISNTGLTFTNGQALSVGTSGVSSILSVYGFADIFGSTALTGVGNTIEADSTLYIDPVSTVLSGSNNYYFTYLNQPPSTGSTTGSAYTMYIAGAPLGSITTSYALYIASGNTTLQSLNANGLISGALGLTITGANTSVTSLTASSLISANLGLTVSGANTSVTSLTASTTLGVTGISTLAAVNASGLISANLGLTVLNGQILNVGTTGITSTLNVFGISNNSGSARFTSIGNSTLTSSSVYIAPAITPVIAASTNFFTYLTAPAVTLVSGAVTNAYTMFIAGAPTISGGGTLTNTWALFINSGATNLQALNTTSITASTTIAVTGISTLGTVNASGLISANLGLTVLNSRILNVGTSGITSTLNVFGSSNLSGIARFTSVGNSTLTSASVYIAPAITTVVASSTNFFTYLTAPAATLASGAATNAYTMFIAGAPTISGGGTLTNSWALFINSGATNLQALNATSIAASTTLAVTGISTLAAVNASGLISGTLGLAISGANTSVTSLSASSLISANLGLSVSGANTSVTSLTASATLGVTGISTLVEVNASGLISANLGLNVLNGQTLNVGTSGITSTLNVFGPSNHSGSGRFTSIGNSTPTSASVYIAPAVTPVIAASTNFFTYLTAPAVTSAAAATNAYTMFIAGAPTISGGGTLTSSWALFINSGWTNLQDLNATSITANTTLAVTGTSNLQIVNTSGLLTANAGLTVSAGKTLIEGDLQITTGAVNTFVSTSDATGNAAWAIPRAAHQIVSNTILRSIVNSTTLTNITGMTLTIPTNRGGTYIAIFSCILNSSNSNRTAVFRLALNNTLITNSNTRLLLSNTAQQTLTIQADFTCVAGDVITVQWAGLTSNFTINLPVNTLRTLTIISVV